MARGKSSTSQNRRRLELQRAMEEDSGEEDVGMPSDSSSSSSSSSNQRQGRVYHSDEDSSDSSPEEQGVRGAGYAADASQSASDEESDGYYSSDSEDSVDRKLAQLKAEMADVPFEEIQRLRKEARLRAQFRRHNARESDHATDFGGHDDASRDSLDSSDSSSEDKGKKGKKGDKKEIKRKNKNRPMEMSAKNPVSRFRQVIASSKKKTIDPRFASLSGKLDMEGFDKAYSFLDDYIEDEIKALKKELKKCKDDKRRVEIQRLMTKKAQELKAKQKANKRREILRKHKKEQREAVSQGKKAFHLKKCRIYIHLEPLSLSLSLCWYPQRTLVWCRGRL
eukprot:TRINITY_DN2518_c1_g3_i7.p1 TRINITY_DN2518_c1_g3~~TRINITY_DN2518_c1_g3_i7.p1  ORF type:complete len:337 (-),score=74.43 TRINITY_DN2518_c1_g3_i7:1768-2778(-)